VRHVLKPGQEADFAFTVKPTRALKAARGLAVAIGQPTDRTPQNNVAYFTVSATLASSATPSAHPSTPASTAPSAAPAPGGGLAHTGGGSDALPLLGAGAAAVVLGAGAVVLARRRRAGSHS
jgi:LPXTG-motif cell wall-anchored protein